MWYGYVGSKGLSLGTAPNFSAGADLTPRSRENEVVVLTNLTMFMKKIVEVAKASIELDRTRTSENSREGGNCSSSPPFSCRTVTKVHIQDAETSQKGSLPIVVLLDVKAVLFFIIVHPIYVMLLK